MVATFDLGVNNQILVFASQKKGVQTAEINRLPGLPRLRMTKSVNDAVASVNQSFKAEQRAFM